MNCSVLEGVECCGNQSFIKTGVPCLKSVASCMAVQLSVMMAVPLSLLVQIQWPLLSLHLPLLCLPGVPGCGQVLPGLYLFGCGQTAHTGRAGGVVGSGHYPTIGGTYRATQ